MWRAVFTALSKSLTPSAILEYLLTTMYKDLERGAASFTAARKSKKAYKDQDTTMYVSFSQNRVNDAIQLHTIYTRLSHKAKCWKVRG